MIRRCLPHADTLLTCLRGSGLLRSLTAVSCCNERFEEAVRAWRYGTPQLVVNLMKAKKVNGHPTSLFPLHLPEQEWESCPAMFKLQV